MKTHASGVSVTKCFAPSAPESVLICEGTGRANQFLSMPGVNPTIPNLSNSSNLEAPAITLGYQVLFVSCAIELQNMFLYRISCDNWAISNLLVILHRVN